MAGKAKAGIAHSVCDETQGVQVKPCYPLTMRAIPERLKDASCEGAVQIDYIIYTVRLSDVFVSSTV